MEISLPGSALDMGWPCRHWPSDWRHSSRTGGASEILQSVVPLLLEFGVSVRWDVLAGSETFYQATRHFHNGLQGQGVKVPDSLVEAHLDCVQSNARMLDLSADVVMTHDPQPLALIDHASTDSRWIWR